MDKLKQFIADHCTAFDTDDLPSGHQLRFKEKLPAKRIIFQSRYLYFLSVAAVVLFACFILPYTLNNKPQTIHSINCQTSEDMQYLSMYYNWQLYDISNQLKLKLSKQNSPGGQYLLQESTRILTSGEYFEDTVVPSLPCTQQSLFAITKFYNANLESLNFMLQQADMINLN
ncbi:MAG: hypothetical protein PUB21_08465 [Bacteroidales bacterium]|nr:hypothetical protein [Bacteroidales bacterium]